ncbi:TENP protein, partial [Calonectris borealis]|nr:TENP protein [Calonectris borealis]
LSILLSLLVPAHTARSPDSGAIITPSGLSYRKSGPRTAHAIFLRQELMAPAGPDPFLSSSTPSSRNQINSIEIAELSLSLIPDTGLRLSLAVDLGITPTPSTTEVTRLSILAELHVEMNPEGNLELVSSACKPAEEEMQGTEEMGRSTPRFSLLWHLGNGGKEETEAQALLGGKICLEVSKFLYLPNEQLSSLTAPLPFTPSSQVQYLPLAAPMFSEQGVIISLQTTFKVAGMEIPLPVSPVPFSVPEPASSSHYHFTLAFSEHFYTSLFFALEMAGAFNMTILGTAAVPRTNPLPRQMGSLFQDDLPVTLQVVFRSTPRVVLEEDKATLKLFLTVHVGAGSPAFQSFLSVNVDVSAGLLFSVAGTRMTISTAAIEDIELSLAASDVGPVPAALLEELLLPTIREEVSAQMNAVLSEGVFLPHASGFTYIDVNVMIHRDYVLVSCNLQLQVRTG